MNPPLSTAVLDGIARFLEEINAASADHDIHLDPTYGGLIDAEGNRLGDLVRHEGNYAFSQSDL